MNKSFSVAMCVYGKDNANYFKEAIFSILNWDCQENMRKRILKREKLLKNDASNVGVENESSACISYK
jgi:hypothetical protein